MRAATEVFAKYEYKKASTDLIASKAGVSKGLLFYYFQNKKELYLTVHEYVKQIIREGVADSRLLEITDFFELITYASIKKIKVLAENNSSTIHFIMLEAEKFMDWRKKMKKYFLPFIMLVIFETVAVTLWLTQNNTFYLFNFSYIGISISLGIFLYVKKYKYARRVAQLLVGLYMLVYLGGICGENMQIEGFWYYLFTGVFEAATIHYAVAKIFGPLLFGRGWCGYACWTAMVLDFLPYKVSKTPRRKIGWIRYVTFVVSFIFVSVLFLAHTSNLEKIMFWAFIVPSHLRGSKF